MKKYLLLITVSPHHPNAKKAAMFAKEKLTDCQDVTVFFYGDGAYTANRLMWQTKDVENVADIWVQLAEQYNLALPVCVSTALARGITDAPNALRHQLDGENVREPFFLVGLSQLAMAIHDDVQVLQF